MILRALLGGSESRAQPPVAVSASSGSSAWGPFWGGANTASGASVTPDSALTFGAVYACVSLIADCIAMLPLHVRRQSSAGSTEPAREHALFRVLHRRPNRWQTAFEYRRMMAAHLLLRGNAYSYIKPSRQAAVAELVPLHPDRVRPFWAPNGMPAYEYTPERGERQVLLFGEVHHWRALSCDGLLGLSPIQLHRESIGLGLQAQEHGARLFSNGAQVSGFLRTAGRLSDAAFDRLRRDWEARYQGAHNAHKPVILEEGLEWQRIGLSLDDVQFLQTRAFQRSEVASIYRVPPHMIGDTEKTSSWGTGVEQQGIGFINYTLNPHLVCIEQSAERDLLTEYDENAGVTVQFNRAALLRGDMSARSEFYQRMTQNGIMTRNECRELEDRPRLPGLDDPLTPVNLSTNTDAGASSNE